MTLLKIKLLGSVAKLDKTDKLVLEYSFYYEVMDSFTFK